MDDEGAGVGIGGGGEARASMAGEGAGVDIGSGVKARASTRRQSFTPGPPFEFVHRQSIDEFWPSAGTGTPMIVTARDLPGGAIEQTLALGDLHMSVVDEQPVGDALPERTVTVSRRRLNGQLPSHHHHAQDVLRASYEVVHVTRALSPQRRASVHDLQALLDDKAALDGQRPSTVRRGDAAVLAELLSSTARAYSISLSTLVEAVKRVGTAEVVQALEELCA